MGILPSPPALAASQTYAASSVSGNERRAGTGVEAGAMMGRHMRSRAGVRRALAGVTMCLMLAAGCSDLPVGDVAADLPAAGPPQPAAPDDVTETHPAASDDVTEMPPTAPDGDGVIWADDFDGPAGSRPDPSTWRYETGGEGWGNNERQYYRDSTDNAALDGDGHLVITARAGGDGLTCWYGPCTYTSARLNTAGAVEQAYGRFEARVRIPSGRGVWPAFWMLGDDLNEVGWPASGEIDVMENIGSEPDVVVGSVHGPGYTGGVSGGHTLPGGRAYADGFHVFAVEWTPQRITWFVDDVRYHSVTPADLDGEWVFDHPFFIVLNVAVGGDWPGDPDQSTTFPQRMVVDHVRVSELD